MGERQIDLSYLWLEISVAHTLLMTVTNSLEKLLEKVLGRVFPGTVVDFDAVKKFATVGEFHNKEDGALGLLCELEDAIQTDDIGVRAYLPHVFDFAENASAAANKVGILLRHRGHIHACSSGTLDNLDSSVTLAILILTYADWIGTVNVNALAQR